MKNITKEAKAAFESILPASERAAMLEGRVIDGYKLEEIIDNESGFGVVYQATHSETKTTAAVKVLKTDISEDPSTRDSFQREIKMMINADNARNIIRFRHGGVFDGMPWYAMEYFEGKRLDQFAKQRKKDNNPISPREVRDIMRSVVIGLEEIQEAIEKNHNKNTVADNRKFVHRDIKPANVMVREHDKQLDVRLLDFGVSWLSEAEQPTMHNTIQTEIHRSFTPIYASPEMLVPRISRHLDSRSDQFQIGLLAFEIITGHCYWKCWDQQPLDRLRNAMSRRALVWLWLERCIERTLSWDPDQRFLSLQDFREALEPTSWPKRLLRWPWWRQRLTPAWWTNRPSRAAAGITTLVSLALILFILFGSSKAATSRTVPTLSAPPGSIASIWHKVEGSFKSCTSASATPQNFQDLKTWCHKFLARTNDISGYSDKRARAAKILHWFDEASKWHVTVKPSSLSWGWGATFSSYPQVDYQIHSIGENGKAFPSPPPVTGKALAGTGTFRGKGYTVTWDPGTRIELELQGIKAGKQTAKTISLIPVKSLLRQASQSHEINLRGTSFKVFYKITAKDVKPLPVVFK